MEQDFIHGWSVLAFLGLYLDRLDFLNLLGCVDSEKELGGLDRIAKFLREDQCEKRLITTYTQWRQLIRSSLNKFSELVINKILSR